MSSTALDLSYRWLVPDQDSDEAGERIVEAALACFAELGIRRTSMDDIARAAGVGRTTVFRRFDSKDRLVQTVMLRVVGQATKRVQAVFESARASVRGGRVALKSQNDAPSVNLGAPGRGLEALALAWSPEAAAHIASFLPHDDRLHR